jgi:hypothetical protein
VAINDRKYMARTADEYEAAEHWSAGEAKPWRELSADLRRKLSQTIDHTDPANLERMSALADLAARLQQIDHNSRALDNDTHRES